MGLTSNLFLRFLKQVVLRDMEREGEIRQIPVHPAVADRPQPAVRPNYQVRGHHHPPRTDVVFLWRMWTPSLKQQKDRPAAVQGTESRDMKGEGESETKTVSMYSHSIPSTT